ncbi:MAG: pilus assembly protein N-terminal domain-containing protein [Verrucomicrobiae bacterium]|nr:pilus assembly protein N-terminal domain-containing protein [Verrucomicrobiae bacterium]
MKLSPYRNLIGCKTLLGAMLAACAFPAIGHGATADAMLVQTNTVAVGESKIIAATGSNIVVATEGLIRLVPVGPGKLVMSGVKAGRTDLLVLDDNGQVKEHYYVIINEPITAPPPPPPPPQRPARKIKIYEGGKLNEFEVNY